MTTTQKQKPVKKEGWGWALNAKKAHYYVDTMSLCRRWVFFGEVEQGNDNSPDNCVACMKALEKRKKGV